MLMFIKALERLLGWIYWLILTLLPILDQSHKGCVLKIAKVPLQISFKNSNPFLAFLVNFWPITQFRKIRRRINDLREKVLY